MAYAQNGGTKAMQLYIHKLQSKLPAHIQEAKEWASAPQNAAFKAMDDWTRVCQCADEACPHGDQECSYRAAAQQVFTRNAATLCPWQLAKAIRDVLVTGPTKTTPVPFLVGPSNSCKSTLLYPFDDLFTPKRVLHKPALGSTFGLRNLVGDEKLLIFWDDFAPVQYASEKTVPVSTFLSLFIGKNTEIQVSQSFNDGNEDIKWNRGVLFTGKQEGLWEPTKYVSEEDIKHLRNRVREFIFSVALPKELLKEVTSCAVCMCRWIRDGANRIDAAPCLQHVLPARGSTMPSVDTGRVFAIRGLQDLLDKVALPTGVAEGLLEDLEELGAVNVTEPSRGEWESLHFWSLLKPLQLKRMLQHLGF